MSSSQRGGRGGRLIWNDGSTSPESRCQSPESRRSSHRCGDLGLGLIPTVLLDGSSPHSPRNPLVECGPKEPRFRSEQSRIKRLKRLNPSSLRALDKVRAGRQKPLAWVLGCLGAGALGCWGPGSVGGRPRGRSADTPAHGHQKSLGINSAAVVRDRWDTMDSWMTAVLQGDNGA